MLEGVSFFLTSIHTPPEENICMRTSKTTEFIPNSLNNTRDRKVQKI